MEADVAIVGAGPTGLTLANLLGMYGVRTIVVERTSRDDVVAYPRAVGIDHDALRTFQALGLVDDMLPDIIQNTAVRFFAENGSTLVELRRQEPAAATTGWYRRNMFMQHLTERVLVDGLSRYDCVRFMHDTTATAIDQDGSGATLSVEDAQDVSLKRLRVGYVIGADGARSTVRRLVGLDLVGDTYAEPWLICEVDNDPWDAPYSSFFCDPTRPVYSGQLPHGHRRFGVMLLPEESDAEALSPDGMRRLLGPLVPDFDELNLIRAHVYRHQARIADRFVRGRVALVGDAAHLMPPWAGQGLNTGIRDVTNLAWKVAAVTRGRASVDLLQTYDAERRPHARAVIETTRRFGRVFVPRDRRVTTARDVVLRAIGGVPALRRRFNRAWFSTPLRYRRGLLHQPDGSQHRVVGTMFVQPEVEADGVRRRLDDVLGNWFAVVSYRCTPEQSEATAELWRTLGARFVRIELSHADSHGESPPTDAQDVYGSLERWFVGNGVDLAVIRPDRVIAAVGSTTDFDALSADLFRRLGDRPTCDRRSLAS